MADITRTTQPLDVEVQLSNGVIYPALSSETELYADWLEAYVSPNPIDSLNAFFTRIADLVSRDELDVEFYKYWYDKLKTSHPVVAASLSATEQFLDVNESVGTLYFAQPDSPTTAIVNMGSAGLKPCPANIENLLPSGIADALSGYYATVNASYATNISNIQTSPSAAPTQAHGVSLVKDTSANARNTSSKFLIKAKLEDKFGDALDLTEIENVISGDIAVAYEQFTDIIEGSTVKIDALTNKVEPTLSTLQTGSLQAV
jgi:hypothetical protein